jgi:hypothetical protein
MHRIVWDVAYEGGIDQIDVQQDTELVVACGDYGVSLLDPRTLRETAKVPGLSSSRLYFTCSP